MALQRADIAISRQGTAQIRAEEADHQSEVARIDSEQAILAARDFSPDFKPAVLERFEKLRYRNTCLPKFEMNNVIQSSMNQVANQRDKIESHPVPNTMYSQQPAVSPQTDLSQFVSNHQIILNKKQQLLQQQLQQQQPMMSMQAPTISNTTNAFENNETNKPDKVLNLYSDHKHNVSNLQTAHNENLINNNNIYMDPIHMKTDEKSSQFRKSSLHNMKPPTLKNINNNQQSSIDFFDHYKRPPSRDSSTDRYTRAASRLSGGSRLTSRQPSIDKTNIVTEPTGSSTPVRKSSETTPSNTNNKNVNNTIGSMNGSISQQPQIPTLSQAKSSFPEYAPFEEIILRQRTLGQDIVPSLLQPKRTESLFVPPKAIGQNVAVSKVLKVCQVQIFTL